MDRRRSRGLNQDAFAPSANLPGLANVHVRIEIGGGNGQHGSAMPAAFNQLPFLCVFSVPCWLATSAFFNRRRTTDWPHGYSYSSYPSHERLIPTPATRSRNKEVVRRGDMTRRRRRQDATQEHHYESTSRSKSMTKEARRC